VKESTLDAAAALNRILARYVEISTQGEILRQIMSVGVQVPCVIWSAYVQARQDYLNKSQSVFSQLAQKGVTVEQVVYMQGALQIDPSDPSKAKSLRLQAPLPPPAFAGIERQCPSVPAMSSAVMHGAMGWESIPVSLGSIPLTAAQIAAATCAVAAPGNCLMLLGADAVVLGVAGQATFQTIKPVYVTLQEYTPLPLRTVAMYTTCFRGRSISKTPSEAAKQCSLPERAMRVQMGSALDSVGAWGWIGIGAVVLGGLWLLLRGRSPRAALNGSVRRRVRRRYSKASDPILLGDLYYQPRGY
jgi:hypothetical protein